MAEEAERNEGPEPCLFNRKIHFHMARKPFNGFSNGNTNGFKLVTLNPNAGIHKLSGSGKKPETAEYFDSGMDPELRWEITVRRIGAGLRNLGNTCFLNSVLQCLTYTEPLAAYLQSGKHQNSCRTTGFCALCAIQKHVSRALQATGRILEPKDLVSNLRCISRSFRNARQEDAHEYMVNLLESMHKCCLPSGVPSESPSAYEKSLVHKIFGGRLRSQVKCLQCSFCSNKFDPFLDLSLEILKADSLQKALCHFTAKEQLDGGAKQYQCQQCKQKVKALKQITIHKAPLVLSVHLKRFGHIHGQKIDKKIAFGSTLNLKPFVSGTYEGDLNYTLYGVLVHAGWSTHSGHYYCFVRTSSGMWYSLDDNQVIQVNERKVLEQKAYMLFYVRDRNSFCRKKPVNILQKENIAKNPNGASSAYSKISRDSNEKTHNDSTENKVDASISATLSTKDGQVATVPKNSPLEMISLPSESYPPSDTLPGVRSPHSRKDPQTLDMNNFGSTASKIDCNNGISAVQGQNPCVFVVPADCSVPKNSNHQKEASGCAAMPSTCSGDKIRDSPNQPVDQLLDSKTPFISPVDACKMDGPNYGKCNGTMPVVTNTEAWNQANCVKLPNENCAADNLVGVDQRSGNAAIEGTRKLKIMAKNKQPQFKVKRKRLKCQAAILLLGSSIILGASFSGGKKKYKPRNQPSMPMVSDGLKPSSCGSNLPSNTEQSLSDKSSLPTDDFTRSRKKVKLISSHENQEMSSNNSISRDVHSDCTERIVLGGGTSAADNQRGTGDSEELARKSREKNVMRMLTQGLGETTVARWDGIDAFSERSEIRGTKNVQIGYIGDEWDEEYDQGKRKKLRQSKMDFDGRNVFQEIASINSKQKRAKLDRKISENPPFRIL